MQRRHRLSQLIARGGVAAVAQALTFAGAYPLVPHAVMAAARRDRGAAAARAAFTEWGVAAAMAAWRGAGFLPLPGAHGHGPRPIILLHGYAMNRANFLPLAWRLARAGLGPIVGFEYWTLGRVARAAHQLGAFVDDVRAATGAAQVDLIGHSMGGVVGRYYVALGGGDGKVANLVTIGSPHLGTPLSRAAIGHPMRELIHGSRFIARLAAAPPPVSTRMTVIWSRADAMVPDAAYAHVPGADEVVLDDLGHLSLLASRRVAHEIAVRLARVGV